MHETELLRITRIIGSRSGSGSRNDPLLVSGKMFLHLLQLFWSMSQSWKILAGLRGRTHKKHLLGKSPRLAVRILQQSQEVGVLDARFFNPVVRFRERCD